MAEKQQTSIMDGKGNLIFIFLAMTTKKATPIKIANTTNN
ncbi:hypothetical protein ECDEC7B_1045 [Escherichia coli DEC7B]|nr:hypothetical protein ECDEC7B_1045 [Escherichia coli DEC7B]